MLGVNGEVTFDAFVRADDGLPVHEVLSYEAIVEQHQVPEAAVEEEPADDDADDGDGDGEPQPLVSTAQSMEAIDVVRRHLCQLPDLPHEYLEMLTKLEALVLSSTKKKQTKIDDFFQKM